MMKKGKLEFCYEVLFVASLICIQGTTTLEWKRQFSRFYYKFTLLPNSMLINGNIVTEETNATTITSCSMFCAEDERYSLYYNLNTASCYCNSDSDTRLDTSDPMDDGSSEIVYGFMSSSVAVSSNTTTTKYEIQPYSDGCLSLYDNNYRTNAVYTVQPMGEPLQDVFCDMDLLDKVLNVGADDCLQLLQAGFTDDGVYSILLSNGTTVRAWCDQTRGGWTVFQRRYDGSVDFYRTWTEYVNGFGDAEGEYWLGLEAIYMLAQQQQSSLRIDMEPFADRTPPAVYALYEDFSLASVSDKYRLSVGTFSGNCGDSLADPQNHQQFTTKDNDNDQRNDENCAVTYKGAWWYNDCHGSNLNGLYLNGSYTSTYGAEGMEWWRCWFHGYSVKTTSMAIRRM